MRLPRIKKPYINWACITRIRSSIGTNYPLPSYDRRVFRCASRMSRCEFASLKFSISGSSAAIIFFPQPSSVNASCMKARSCSTRAEFISTTERVKHTHSRLREKLTTSVDGEREQSSRDEQQQTRPCFPIQRPRFQTLQQIRVR